MWNTIENKLIKSRDITFTDKVDEKNETVGIVLINYEDVHIYHDVFNENAKNNKIRKIVVDENANVDNINNTGAPRRPWILRTGNMGRPRLSESEDIDNKKLLELLE